MPYIFKDILNGDAIPDKGIELGDFETVLLVTVGDNIFPKFAWLLKAYDKKDPQQRFFNKRMCSARVVMEKHMVCLKADGEFYTRRQRWKMLIWNM